MAFHSASATRAQRFSFNFRNMHKSFYLDCAGLRYSKITLRILWKNNIHCWKKITRAIAETWKKLSFSYTSQSREDQSKRVKPHTGLIPKATSLKLFLAIVPSPLRRCVDFCGGFVYVSFRFEAKRRKPPTLWRRLRWYFNIKGTSLNTSRNINRS